MAESYNFLRVPPQLLEAVLDNPYEGTVIIDDQGHSAEMRASGRVCLGIPPGDSLLEVGSSGFHFFRKEDNFLTELL